MIRCWQVGVVVAIGLVVPRASHGTTCDEPLIEATCLSVDSVPCADSLIMRFNGRQLLLVSPDGVVVYQERYARVP